MVYPNNPDVATVNGSNGTVTANSCGMATITASAHGESVSYTLWVMPLAESTYLFNNTEKNGFIQIDNDASDNYSQSGVHMEHHTLDGGDYQKWALDYLNNGYYKIISVESGLVLSVPSGSENSSDVDLIQEAYGGYNRQQWEIIPTAGGRYKIKARSAPSNLVICVNSGTANGTNIQQDDYLNNNSYLDEWIFEPYSVVFYGITNTNHDHLTCLNTIANDMANDNWNDVLVRSGEVSATVCKSDLMSKNVFTSRSHGLLVISAGTDNVYATGIILNDKEDDESVVFLSHSYSGMSIDSISISSGDDYSRIDVALFIGCNTAKGGDGGRNLPTTIVEHGASAAIGFTERIDCAEANIWTINFYNQMLQGATLQEAVEYACDQASETSGLKSAEICGDRTLRFPQ